MVIRAEMRPSMGHFANESLLDGVGFLQRKKGLHGLLY